MCDGQHPEAWLHPEGNLAIRNLLLKSFQEFPCTFDYLLVRFPCGPEG
jgi:hypothetical protein